MTITGADPGGVSPPGERSHLAVWTDPACPWAWQTARWLLELRDRGVLTLEWRIFSLEVNSSEPDVPFWEAAQRNGEAQVSLALARREGGDRAFEASYLALGRLRHDERQPMSPELVRKAAADAGMEGLVERAVADPSLAEEVVREYRDARELDVFGVPTLQLLPGGLPIYGPILPLAPTGEDALAWWTHIRFALEREDLYELKRWPRPRRPGRPPEAPDPAG